MVSWYQWSALAVALSYFCIPVAFAWVAIKRPEILPNRPIMWAFIGVFTMCGLTHTCDFFVFWWAPYRLITTVMMLCAAVSVPTAISLPWVVHRVMQYRSPEEYEKAAHALAATGQELVDELARRQRHNDNLRRECNELRDLFETIKYQQVDEDRYQRLRKKLHDIRGA